MSRPRRLCLSISVVALFALVALGGPSAGPVDWSSCQDDLDRARRSARDASDYASEVESKHNELQDCVNYPDTYDLLQDGCRHYRTDYEDAKTNLTSELDTLNNRLRDVQYSCGYRFSLGAAAPIPGNSTCQVMLAYKGRLPDSQLLSFCKARMSEEECKRCLGLQ